MMLDAVLPVTHEGLDEHLHRNDGFATADSTVPKTTQGVIQQNDRERKR
jgi:hypothetical protein